MVKLGNFFRRSSSLVGVLLYPRLTVSVTCVSSGGSRSWGWDLMVFKGPFQQKPFCFCHSMMPRGPFPAERVVRLIKMLSS